MASPQAAKIISMLRSQPRPSSAPTYEQSRRGMESFARGADADVRCTPVDANGVPAEWVDGPGVDVTRAILYLHGGGYTAGSVVTHRQLAGWLSKAAGTRVLIIDYRLAPEHPHPAAVDDAVDAYQFLLAQGIAPGHVVIAGDSAGGGLTAAALIAIRDRGLANAAGGVMISAWTDLSGSGESLMSRASLDPMISDGGVGLRKSARAYQPEGSLTAPTASPLFADLAGLPPLLIQVGTHEVLFDDSTRFDAAARAAGVETTLEVWNEMVHVFHVFAWMLPEAREAIESFGAFVKERTGAVAVE